jgi:hypothetical protein
MWAKGVQGGNYLPPRRQDKVCMVKATLLKPQVSGSYLGQRRRIIETPFRPVAPYKVSAEQLSQAGLLSVREMKGPNRGPNHTVSPHKRTSGLPKLVIPWSWNTCKVAEPPYYSRLARNGCSRQAPSLYRYGHKPVAIQVKGPLSGRKGGSLTRVRNPKGGYADAT